MILVDSLTSSDTALIDSAWRGAEAYHFYILAQQQWYNGQVEFCLRTVSSQYITVYTVYTLTFAVFADQ